MYKVKGGCHCGNIRLEAQLTRAPETYSPRACDCDFCRKHGASYLSDPDGALQIHVRDMDLLGKYRQGSGIADCLFCKCCGVLIGVTHRINGQLCGAINTQAVEDGTIFGEKKPVSPKELSASAKTERWNGVWFSNVTLTAENV